MSIVKLGTIDNNQLAVKKPIIFGSAVDLAHIFNKTWVDNNLALLLEMDVAFSFIYKELVIKKEKNFFERFMFKRNIKKTKLTINSYLHELRSLVSEIEALIGFNVFLRSGNKSKIKNKKVFDDHVSEHREIAIMLQGLLLFLETTEFAEIDFSNEIQIMDELQKTSKFKPGYFIHTCSFLTVFTF